MDELLRRLYDRQGFSLVALNGKRPIKKKWNEKRKSEKIKEGNNVGVKLSYSGICCFDIDNLKRFKKIAKKQGLWKLIKNGVQYTSGKKNRLKILFRCKPLPSVPLGRDTGQFRCADRYGNTLQDVLPPSKHPSGSIYEWITPEWKHWVPYDELPVIPKLPKKIANLAMNYHSKKKSGSSEFKAPYVDVFNEWAYKNGRTVDYYINLIGGYTAVFGGWRRNGSDNPLAIKVFAEDDAYNFSTTEEQPISYGPMDLYKLFVLAEYNGDESKARKWVATNLSKQVDEAYNEKYLGRKDID